MPKMRENGGTVRKMEMKGNMTGKLGKTSKIEGTVRKMRKLQEGHSGKTVGKRRKRFGNKT